MSGAGAAYLFRRSGRSWVIETYLKASNPGPDDHFGVCVALSADGDTAAVGATFEDSSHSSVGNVRPNDSQTDPGAVYGFDRSR
ncbi:MAG: hypothetical protein AAFZ18_09195 [Myxococcota bacterium]